VAVLTAKPLTARPLIARPLTARAIGESALAFAIRDLFANGELGAFIDYTDLSTLFENSDGTTAVTSVGDPIGYARDKSGNNNHATQSTDTARPWRGRRPAGGRRNLLDKTEKFDTSPWTKENFGTAGELPVITENAASAPDGSFTASEVVFDAVGGTGISCILQNIGATTLNGQGTFSVWMRVASGTATVRLRQDFDGGSTSNNVTVTDEWQRFSVSTPAGETGIDIASIRLRPSVGTSTTATVFIWGGQLESGSTATPYQRVAAPYDITEEGVASRFYAWDDEVDDDMTIVLPDLGTDATRVTVDRDGNVTYLENQTISGSVSVPLNSQAVIYINRDLTADEKAGIEGLY
jgi:hypothetical protein